MEKHSSSPEKGGAAVFKTTSPTAATTPQTTATSAAATRTTSSASKPPHSVVVAQAWDVISLLLVYRFLNSLCVRTFFQPDEYFQALEPAWDIAFGHGSGAWMTWEWEHQLRSSLHPLLFGAAYKVTNGLLDLVVGPPALRSVVFVFLPKLVQSVIAAFGDFYTWRLATLIYGSESNIPWAALWFSVLNPWQWYCSTRTFSNSLETTLTIMALYYWPWTMFDDASKVKTWSLRQATSMYRLRLSLSLAAVAVVLRPTNLIVWLGILALALTRMTLDGTSPLQWESLVVLFREIILCGSGVLTVSLLSDRYYFGFWTFPPYKFLYFNISQSLAVFYGHMPWHYYLSQGLPLLSTTFLPFVLVGLWKSTTSLPRNSVRQSNTLKALSFTVLTMVGTLSVISHKEVRFIYPLLPILHILAAPYLVLFFTVPPSEPSDAPAALSPSGSPRTILRHKVSLANILSINILLAGYLSVLHQPAPISVLNFLRTDFERVHVDSLTIGGAANVTQPDELFALFLTPCHSTPWRSHLVYAGLRARALTCEPPLHTAPGSVERREYLDEADRFYAEDPTTGQYGLKFLAEEMWPVVATDTEGVRRGGEIPRYIIGFEQIGPLLQQFFDGEDAPGKGMGVKLTKVWAGWNGLFNEDWRRRGSLVVWATGIYPDSPES